MCFFHGYKEYKPPAHEDACAGGLFTTRAAFASMSSHAPLSVVLAHGKGEQRVDTPQSGLCVTMGSASYPHCRLSNSCLIVQKYIRPPIVGNRPVPFLKENALVAGIGGCVAEFIEQDIVRNAVGESGADEQPFLEFLSVKSGASDALGHINHYHLPP